MDIRIGNDICVQIPISEFGSISSDNIKEIRCAFINQKNTWPHDYEFHPAFHCSTQYTIRSCGYYSYNVHPHNMHIHCMNNDPHCGSVVCRDKFFLNRFESYCDVSNGYINAYFPAEFQRTLGPYECVFEIKVKEEGWDCDDIHTYTASYNNVFSLKNNGIQGRTIVINPIEEKEYDTYICAITKEELQKHEDDYTKLILISEGFKFTDIPGLKKNVVINNEDKKIVVISKYDSLQFKIDQYIIPMSVKMLNGDYYMYISDDVYSNRFTNIEIIDTKKSNNFEILGEWREIIKKDKLNIIVDPDLNLNQYIPVNGGNVKITITRSYELWKTREIKNEEGEHLRDEEKLIQIYTEIPIDGDVSIESQDVNIQWSGSLIQNSHTFNIEANDTGFVRDINFIIQTQQSISGIAKFKQLSNITPVQKTYSYYGSSNNKDNMNIHNGTKIEINDNETRVTVYTNSNDFKYVHWCAIPEGYVINTITCNNLGNNVIDMFKKDVIDGYTIYYYVATRLSINDSTTFIITKE